MQRDGIRESGMQREKEGKINKISLTLCGLGKKIGRGKGEEGLWLVEMSYSAVNFSLPVALGVFLGQDVDND